MKTMTHKSIIAMSIILMTILNITSCFFDMGYNKGELVHIDFDNHNTHKVTGNNGDIGRDKILSNWNDRQLRPNGVLEDNHGNVYQMYLSDWIENVYAEISVNIKKDSVLTFEFKSEAQQYKNKPGVLQVEIADERNPDNPTVTDIRHNGRGDGWCKASVPISRGKKTIKWNVPRRSDHVGENVIYLDNITIVPNVIDDVVIYPKGKQETFVEGNPIRFAAYPIRMDKSIVTGEHVSYSVNNGGYIDSNGVFSPTKEGNFTITARVGNKTAYKTDVYVHGKNYLEEPVEIGNYKFTGKVELKPQIINERVISNLDTSNVKYDYTVTPMDINFNADGFFVLKGTTKVPLYIEVSKNNSNLKTYFLIRKTGDFCKRIWLRFGNGDYTVKIIENNNMRFSDGNHSGPSEISFEGELLDANITSNLPRTTLNVTNTNSITEREAKYLLPSEAVQSDSFIISNTANSILEDLGSRRTEGNILRAIHDYVIHYLYQDITSLKNPNSIKRQDAVHVLFYGMATYDGYSNFFAALARNCGIKTQIVNGKVTKCDINTGYYYNNLEHTWNNVFYKGNYYLVDTALDDPFPKNPSINYNERGIMTENYTYFMVPLSDEDHKNGGNDTFRSINKL